jgi:DNA-binding SARP family transcriptional activator
MRFGLLGPLQVHDGAATIDVPGARLRVLLAALLIRAGQPVSSDTLAETVWDGSPPDGAAKTLRSHVMRLRRVLGPAAGPRVVTRYPGYLIEAATGEVDLLGFTALCRDGSAAIRQEQWERASATLDQALALWRGQPLADIPSQTLHRNELPGLEQARLQALEWRAEAQLHLGRHDDLVAGLQELAGRHPLRERFHAQLMLALYRCGRQAEALDAYRAARATVRAELGVEPGAELQRLHQQILSADRSLSPPTATQPASSPAAGGLSVSSPPARFPLRQLPPATRHFVGRSTELAVLDSLLAEGAGTERAVVISAIGGTAGVGKTALAVHWAHQAAGRFPDGQMYVNLRGFDPSGEPVPPDAALRGLLTALGVEPQRIPAEADAQASLYRSLLAGRRMLIVADNARDEGQVRPLLPGSQGCLVLVTSRRQLGGLAAADGAQLINLDLLSDADARDLLARRLGLQRLTAEPEAVAELIGLCARLPLALALVAARAATQHDLPLARLAAELRDSPVRLDALDVGDAATSVRAVFACSLQHLTRPAARLFRLAGLHPAAEFTRYAAASLAGLPLAEADQLLTELRRAHMVTEPSPGRFGQHDLLRGYAADQARACDSDRDRHAALTRLFDYCLAAAARAMDVFSPAEQHRRPRLPRQDAQLPPMMSPTAARDWLDTERAALVAAATEMTAGGGWDRQVILLAATLSRYLENCGHHADAVIVHTRALAAARRTGDLAAQADALCGLGLVDTWQSRYQQGERRFRQALGLSRQAGDRMGEACTLANLGVVEIWRSRHEQAASELTLAAGIFREIGDPFGEAGALCNLGIVELSRGRYAAAAAHLRRSLTLQREISDNRGAGHSLDILGAVLGRQGSYPDAVLHHQQALEISRQIGHRRFQTSALDNLGIVESRRGNYAASAAYHRQALALSGEIGYAIGKADAVNGLGRALLGQGELARAAGCFREALTAHLELGNREGEAEALLGLGEALLAAGRPAQARDRLSAALSLATGIGDPHLQALAHDGIGRAEQVGGQVGRARKHWELALSLFAELGAPEAEQVRARLAELADNTHRAG